MAESAYLVYWNPVEGKGKIDFSPESPFSPDPALLGEGYQLGEVVTYSRRPFGPGIDDGGAADRAHARARGVLAEYYDGTR